MNKPSVKLDSIFVVLLFFFSLYPLTSTATDISSSDFLPSIFNNTTLYVGGSGPHNYTKIQDAINNTSEGDTVFVYSGLYAENILIRTSIHLIGENCSSTIIDGKGYSTVVTVSVSNVVIQGFTVQNAKNEMTSAGIEISTANNVIVAENIIQDNGGLGIFVRGPGASSNTIDGNTIRNNSYGVYLLDTPKANISGNIIIDNGQGMYIIGSSFSKITNNTFVNRGLALHLEGSFGIIISSNMVVNNANGIYLFNSSEITLSANTVRENRWYGIWLKDSSQNTIVGNSISDNVDVGLFLESSFETTIINNTLVDNDNGIYLKDSSGNIVQKNNLRNYKFNACFVAHTLVHSRNIWRSNYWERARVLPYPILGQIKLEKITLSWSNFDWTPLRQPPQSDLIKKLNKDGTILYVGGNGPNNYSSIQNAIEDASNNDTVYVFNGTYYEAVIINKSLRLIGENKTATILEGNGTRDIITIIADYVDILNFTIQNGHFNILVNHSSYGAIIGNNISRGLHGVSVQNGCQFLTISKNSLQENVYGVRLFSSTDATISYNTFHSYKMNAFYFGTSIAHGRHHWYQNYWDKPRHLPYIIFGKIRLGNFALPWLNCDCFPLSSPYQGFLLWFPELTSF